MSKKGSDGIPSRRNARKPLSKILAWVLVMDVKAVFMIKKAACKLMARMSTYFSTEMANQGKARQEIHKTLQPALPRPPMVQNE